MNPFNEIRNPPALPKEIKFEVDLKCDAYIDQDRFIGTDPIGFKCFNKAKFEMKNGPIVCERCKTVFENEPDRVAFRIPWGRAYAEQFIKDAIHAMEDEMRDGKI